MPIRNINVATNAGIATSKIAEDSGLTSSHMASSAVLDRHLSAKLRTGFIPLDIATARIVSSTGTESWANGSVSAGGMMSSVTSPAYIAASTAVRQARVHFSSGTSPAIQFSPIILPPDLSSGSAARVKFLAASEGSTDAGPSLEWTLYNSTGSSNAASTVAISSAAKSTVQSSFSFALAGSSIHTYPRTLTLAVNAVSTEDQTYMTGAWITYTRQSTA